MPGFVGLPEIILFGIVALLIFGPKKLPEMGRSLGKGMREFKNSVSGDDKPAEIEGSERSPVQMDAADAANPFEPVATTTTPSSDDAVTTAR